MAIPFPQNPKTLSIPFPTFLVITTKALITKAMYSIWYTVETVTIPQISASIIAAKSPAIIANGRFYSSFIFSITIDIHGTTNT